MARLICVAVALFVLVASAQALVPPPYSPPPYSGGGEPYGGGGELPPVEADMALFKDFMTTFGRTYSGAEKDARFECFRKNLRLIEERNVKGQNVERHGVNRFADVCAEEFKAKYLTHRSNTANVGGAATGQKPTGEAACQKIDWRTKGAVTPVQNEGMCGSCWAFSTVQNIEGVIAASGKPLVPLSVQELIDCSGPAGNDGCNGGELAWTYEWVIQNGGLDSAADYPYRASQGVCNKKKEKKHVGVISGYMNITQNEADIASAVCKYGPINVAVDATSWQMYTGGVLQTCPYQSLDFSATIVGFDLTATPPYWILKSSWSSSWGENGYISLEYGKNLCGINQEAVTATL